jgi:hypothetical protein
MSYILDALKKAERERGTARASLLPGEQDPIGRGRTRLAAVAGVILLCFAAALLFFWSSLTTFFRNPNPALAAREPNVAATRPESGRTGNADASSAVAPPLTQVSPPTVRAARPHDSSPPAAVELRGSPRPAAVNLPDSAAQNSRDEVRSPAPVARGEPAGAPQPAAVTAIETLPQQAASNAIDPATSERAPALRAAQPGVSLEEAVAKMTLNILVYEEAEAERRVFINGKKYIKGDLVEGKYLLERITVEGAMLSFEGAQVLLRPR